MKETSFKAGVIGGVFTFLALFATTSKASVNEPAATNGDYKINRVQYAIALQDDGRMFKKLKLVRE